MQPTKDNQTVWRTPNPQCPSCQAKRMHSREEFSQFHKEAGTGTTENAIKINEAETYANANAIKKATDSPASDSPAS